MAFIKLRKLTTLLLIFCTGMLFNCTESGLNQPETEVKEIKETSSGITLDGNQLRVLTLPTPVQLASILDAYGVNYNADHLTKINETHVYSSNYSRAVCGGIYAVNLGYSAIFNDHEKSVRYFNHLNSVLTDIGIKTYTVSELNKRYGKNIEKPDSLSKIILETYDAAHKFLISNEQEEVGFYLLSGSYLEGLNLLCQTNTAGFFSDKKQLFHNLFGQHKIFLDNLIEISGYTSSNDENTLELTETLLNLQKVFSRHPLIMDGKKLEMKSALTKVDIQEIQQIITLYKDLVMS
ncbi:MAG: hypothetical protein JKY42_10510 [Flavobacteriales bacterium]|nr:hypothetical protein [Flavobacteriales bacterium]